MSEISTSGVNTDDMSVLIGGGTGFIGRNLSKHLKSIGYDVIIVSRRPGPGIITWNDLKKNGLPQNCEAVVGLAGENLMNPLKRWGPSFEKELYDSRINTTRALAEAISKADKLPEVFVSTSAVGYYPPDPVKAYTEESPGGNHDFLSRLTADWEAATQLSPSTAPSVRHSIVRVGVVLGRDGGVIQQSYIPFSFGLGGRIGSGKQWFPWIHISDIVGIYKHVITNPNVSGVLNGVAPEHVTNTDFTQAFAKALHRPAFFPVPGFLMHLVFGDIRAKVILEGQRVIPERTLNSGYEFQFPDIQSACNQLAS